jgi:hypothetical protein
VNVAIRVLIQNAVVFTVSLDLEIYQKYCIFIHNLRHGAEDVLRERRGAMMALIKQLFAFLLGSVLSTGAVAQSCGQYTGPGSEIFTSSVENADLFGFACVQATVPDGATIAVDWISGGGTSIINLNLYGADGSYQYFDGSGGLNTSWLFEAVPGGLYNINTLYSGELGSTATLVVGVYGGTTQPIPEPSTYALMLAGLAAVGFAAKRRRERQFLTAH